MFEPSSNETKLKTRTSSTTVRKKREKKEKKMKCFYEFCIYKNSRVARLLLHGPSGNIGTQVLLVLADSRPNKYPPANVSLVTMLKQPLIPSATKSE